VAYVPLQIGTHVPPSLCGVLANIVDPALKEIHILLPVIDPEQGSKGSMQRSMAVLILSAIDGAAQLFHPGKGFGPGDRFKRYVETNFPWKLDPPNGFGIPEAANALYELARCPLIHRFGAHSGENWLKYAKVFTITEASIEDMERLLDERPYSASAIAYDGSRILIYVEALYWCLRLSIIRALDTLDKCREVERWLESGEWDHKRKSYITIPEASDSTAMASVAISTKLQSEGGK
jgi:hypothetical protein